MTARLSFFATDIQRARDIVGLGQAVGSMTVGVVDSSDVYRAGLVQSVAAMDHYFHGLILDLGVDILLGRRELSGSHRTIGLSFAGACEILNLESSVERELAVRKHLAERLAKETFQAADDIGAALSLVGVPRVWKTAFPTDPRYAKAALGVVITRRNRIVHNADGDPLSAGMVTVLTAEDALDAIATVEGTVVAIDELI